MTSLVRHQPHKVLVNELAAAGIPTAAQAIEAKNYFRKLRRAEWGCLAIYLISQILLIIEYFYEFDDAPVDISMYSISKERVLQINARKSIAVRLLTFALICTIVLIFMRIYRYWIALKFKQKSGLISKHAGLLSGEEKFPLILEILALLVIPYPWFVGIDVEATTLTDNLPIKYNLNAIIQFFAAFRLLLCLEIILSFAPWSDDSSQRLCQMLGARSGRLFTIRCIMKANSTQVVLIAFFLSLPFFAFIIMVAEAPTLVLNDSPRFTYPNALWNILITIMTIGYGDYYPRTFLGRMGIFIVSLWGVVIISLVIVALLNILSMEPAQEKAYWIIKRLKLRKQMENLSAHILTHFCKGILTAKRGRAVSLRNVVKCAEYSKKLKEDRRDYRRIGENLVQEDQTAMKLDSLEKNMQALRKENKELLKMIQELVQNKPKAN